MAGLCGPGARRSVSSAERRLRARAVGAGGFGAPDGGSYGGSSSYAREAMDSSGSKGSERGVWSGEEVALDRRVETRDGVEASGVLAPEMTPVLGRMGDCAIMG